MNMVEIKKIAKQRGLKIGKLRKTELIRAIQTAEGNDPCFQTHWEDCGQIHCWWKKDCDSVN